MTEDFNAFYATKNTLAPKTNLSACLGPIIDLTSHEANCARQNVDTKKHPTLKKCDNYLFHYEDFIKYGCEIS